jgi:predicted ATPase
MNQTKRPITSLRVQNFKAVNDTGVLKPGGLTVFIGDNGTGKSSVTEALRFMAALSRESLDAALEPFGGYDHLRWKGGEKRHRGPGLTQADTGLEDLYPVEITVRGHVDGVRASATTRLSGQNKRLVVFDHEELKIGAESPLVRHADPLGGAESAINRDGASYERADRSILVRTTWFDDWHFLSMVPAQMRWPVGARPMRHVRIQPPSTP